MKLNADIIQINELIIKQRDKNAHTFENTAFSAAMASLRSSFCFVIFTLKFHSAKTCLVFRSFNSSFNSSRYARARISSSSIFWSMQITKFTCFHCDENPTKYYAKRTITKQNDLKPTKRQTKFAISQSFLQWQRSITNWILNIKLTAHKTVKITTSFALFMVLIWREKYFFE